MPTNKTLTFHPKGVLGYLTGNSITSIAPLDEEFYDKDETGPMFVIEVDGLDGVVHAFADEIREG